MLRAAHCLPDRISIAVVPVHAKFLDTYSTGRKPGDRNHNVCGGSSHIIVVVIPQEHVQLMAMSRSNGIDVRLPTHAVLKDLFDRQSARAFHPHPVSRQFAVHSEDVHHGLIDAVGRQLAEASEIGLVFKFKCPGDGSFDVQVVFPGEFVGPGYRLRHADAVKRTISVAVLTTFACSASYWVRFAQDDGSVLPLRVGGDDSHAEIHRTQLFADVHLHMSVDKLRTALGVVADEIEGRAQFSSGVVPAAGAVFEKLPQEGFGLSRMDPCYFRPANSGLRQYLAD